MFISNAVLIEAVDISKNVLCIFYSRTRFKNLSNNIIKEKTRESLKSSLSLLAVVPIGGVDKFLCGLYASNARQ